ncbi:hypothetical protein Tco_1231015, partial [Tanacetum coccineum]
MKENGSFDLGKEKNLVDSDVESVADLFANLDTREIMATNHHEQKVEEEVKDCNYKESLVEPCVHDVPSDSDPFGLASLINKKCVKEVKEVNDKSSETHDY